MKSANEMIAADPSVAAQMRKAFADDRRGFIGGSDIGALIGVSPFKDAYALYLEKRGEIDPPEEETKAMRRGKILEPAIVELYGAEHSAHMLPGLTTALAEPWMRAQLDAREQTGDAIIPVEIKSASEFTRGKWGPSGTDDAPTAYCAQLHWQMAAIRAPYGRIVALLGADDLRVYTIERDPKIEEFLLTQAHEFWLRVQEGRPPDPDYRHASMADTLSRLFKNPNATEIVQATDDLRAWRDVMVESGKLAKQYDETRDSARAHLLLAMRNAAILNFDDGTMFERKVVKRKGYTVADSQYIDARMKKSKAAGDLPALPESVSNGQ